MIQVQLECICETIILFPFRFSHLQMHLVIRASIGLLLVYSAVTKADVFDPYYDPLVAEASQQQSSFSSISTSNTVGQGSRPNFQSVSSFSGHNNGQHFGGTVVNNNGQISHHSHPGKKVFEVFFEVEGR